MESAAALRSFNHFMCSVSRVPAILGKPCAVSVCKADLAFPSISSTGGLAVGLELFPYSANRKDVLVSCMKVSDDTGITKPDDSSGNCSQALGQNNAVRRAAFPNGFEALLFEVCDETEVAELKVKVGDFEMHVKRSVGAATAAPLSAISPTTPPAIPSEPMNESAPLPASPPPKPSPEKSTPTKNPLSEKSLKLAALEASGASGFVSVYSPTVGSFRKGRTVKGKKLPPICKQGDVIKEGQVIGYVHQFGSVLPVKSDVAGEVLKFLYEDGEAVGYGDPLVAILPSFHGINLM